jgi:hypothetical protein
VVVVVVVVGVVVVVVGIVVAVVECKLFTVANNKKFVF